MQEQEEGVKGTSSPLQRGDEEGAEEEQCPGESSKLSCEEGWSLDITVLHVWTEEKESRESDLSRVLCAREIWLF